MTYIKLNNGAPEPYSFAQLRRDNPNVSFPRNPPPDVLLQYGMYPVEDTGPPAYNSEKQVLVDDGIVEQGGKYVRQWTKVNVPIAQRRANVADDAAKLMSQNDTVVQATVDLVMQAVSGGLGGLDRAQVLEAYEDLVRTNLRIKRGL